MTKIFVYKTNAVGVHSRLVQTLYRAGLRIEYQLESAVLHQFRREVFDCAQLIDVQRLFGQRIVVLQDFDERVGVGQVCKTVCRLRCTRPLTSRLLVGVVLVDGGVVVQVVGFHIDGAALGAFLRHYAIFGREFEQHVLQLAFCGYEVKYIRLFNLYFFNLDNLFNFLYCAAKRPVRKTWGKPKKTKENMFFLVFVLFL